MNAECMIVRIMCTMFEQPASIWQQRVCLMNVAVRYKLLVTFTSNNTYASVMYRSNILHSMYCAYARGEFCSSSLTLHSSIHYNVGAAARMRAHNTLHMLLLVYNNNSKAFSIALAHAHMCCIYICMYICTCMNMSILAVCPGKCAVCTFRKYTRTRGDAIPTSQGYQSLCRK